MGFEIEIGSWVEALVEFLIDNFTPAFDGIAWAIGLLANGLEDGLRWIPWWAFIAGVALLALWRLGWRFAVFTIVALLLVVGMGLATLCMMGRAVLTEGFWLELLEQCDRLGCWGLI